MRKLFLLLIGVVFFASQALAQRTVTGKVTDDKGNPLPNVSVLVKGSTTGVATKSDGTFSIQLPSTAKALVFSSIDMETNEITVGTGSFLEITLKSVDKALQEVVVTGYGTSRKKRDEAGAISTVLAAQIENKPNVSFDKALQGKAAGVFVQANNGIPGGAINVRIRGAGSINAGCAGGAISAGRSKGTFRYTGYRPGSCGRQCRRQAEGSGRRAAPAEQVAYRDADDHR